MLLLVVVVPVVMLKDMVLQMVVAVVQEVL